MLVALQVVGVASSPLNLTVLVPLVAPKFVPVIVTTVPDAPEVGDRLVTLGPGNTVKVTPLLGNPPTVTTTVPVVAPAGTGATMLVALQVVGVVSVPLNRTELVPCVAPKFAPVIVTGTPIVADVGDRVVMLGRRPSVNVTPLLGNPPTVTTTGPVVVPTGTGTTILVSLQVVGVAVVVLNRTVLVPFVAPKLAPAIVTTVPTGPDAGVSVVMDGTIVKVTPLLG